MLRAVQERHAADPATLIGRGKAEKSRGRATKPRGDLVVFDNELIAGAAAKPRGCSRRAR